MFYKNKLPYYPCRCRCGKEKNVRYYALLNGNSTSCGCARNKKKLRGKDPEEYIGQVFGSWTVLGVVEDSHPLRFECRCTCGKEKAVSAEALLIGQSKSCGCAWAKVKPEDMLGKQFGKWTVLALDPERTAAVGPRYYKCRCECGTERSVQGRMLRSGQSKSCGCARNEERRKDLNPGQQFGSWTVLQLDEERTTPHQRYYKCRCACGEEKSVLGRMLRTGQSKSCGCARNEERRKDLTPGQQFGSWTVLQLDEDRTAPHQRYYKCRCVCGKEKSVSGASLRAGQSKSCGCSRAKDKPEEMLGEQFGKWTVLALDAERSAAEKQGYYKCRCACGTEKSVSGFSLRTGLSTSCGCSRAKDKPEEMLGKQFGKWEVLALDAERSAAEKKCWYKCRCACGTERTISGSALRSGRSKSCGCTRSAEKLDDMPDKQIGSWTVLELDPELTEAKGQRCYKCRCACGTEKSVRGSSLRAGRSTSCGCNRGYWRKAEAE